MEKDEKYVELLWHDKYKKMELGHRNLLDYPNLPFQVIETVNKPRAKGGINSSLFPEDEWPDRYPKDWKNNLIWGDNKLVISSLLKQGWSGKINLIYIDPPFYTGADFSYSTQIDDTEIEKEPSVIEQRAYRDTWSGGIASYLKYMYERLSLMRDLLTEDGSIYVHLDWRVGHYVKVMCDEIFGYDNFVNEIVWCYTGPRKSPKAFSRKHDVILTYCKGNDYKFNEQRVPHKSGVHNTGQVFGDFSSSDPKLKDEMEKEGKLLEDWWIDIWSTDRYRDELIGYSTQKPEALLRRIIAAASDEGDIIADFFCGSGTTLSVAEKMGRRWIGSDLSKYAIQVTRKRLLDIHNSKDLINEDIDEYGKPSRPFEIWNIGNYELAYWKENPDDYLSFMIKLYKSKPISGYKYIQASGDNRAVHIGPINAPVSMEEVRNFVSECVSCNFTKADVLGWEWNYEVNELAKKVAEREGIELNLIQIPNVNELKSALAGTKFDLKLLKIPDQVIEKNLIPAVKFNPLAYLEISKKIKGKEIALKIEDFQIPATSDVSEIINKIKDSRQLIDYWAVDWDYKSDTFHNQWQSYRTKKDLKVEYDAQHVYEDNGEHIIMVKVVDVFGNDTNKILKVKM
jgi:adenine-specific DNA-methyltransferase